MWITTFRRELFHLHFTVLFVTFCVSLSLPCLITHLTIHSQFSFSYLFNPFTIITCGGYSTLLLTNLSIIFAVWMKLRGMLLSWSLLLSFVHGGHIVPPYTLGSDLLSALGLALAVNFSLYPVMLFCPLVLMAYKVWSI